MSMLSSFTLLSRAPLPGKFSRTDQVLLTIRYIGGRDDSPASKLDVRLLMPLGYDGKKVKAAIVPGGWLQIIIANPKHETEKIEISA